MTLPLVAFHLVAFKIYDFEIVNLAVTRFLMIVKDNEGFGVTRNWVIIGFLELVWRLIEFRINKSLYL
jgi:hypothetical protein